MFAQRRITKLARVCIVSHSFGQALEAEGFARGYRYTHMTSAFLGL